MAKGTSLKEFNMLRKMNMQKRMQTATNPQSGATLLSMLTPTQIAELFPDYYRRSLPDVGGFISAQTTKQLQQKQEALKQQIESSVSSGIERNNTIQERRRRSSGGGGGNQPIPELTPAERAAYDAVRAGNIPVDDPRVKFLEGLSDASLAKAGISKFKDETGHTLYKYSAPTFTDEQVKAGMSLDNKSRYSVSDVARLARSVGATPEEAAMMGAISRPESRGDPKAWNRDESTGDNSIGLMQFNLLGKLGPSRRKALGLAQDGSEDYKLQDPKFNMKAALMLKRGQIPGNIGGWQNWSTYKNGLHQPYLDEATRGANSPIVGDGITRNYSKEEIEANRQQMVQNAQADQVRGLAGVVRGRDGPTGTISYGENADFSKYIMYEHSGRKCQEGTRKLAARMYGWDGFNQGGGNADQVGPGGYYQKSKFFQEATIANRDQLSNQAYLDSLPVGTVVSVGGGKGGHVQIKIAPNQWASDFPQGNRVLLNRKGEDYDGVFYVSKPNNEGLKALADHGVNQTVNTSSQTTQKTDTEAGPVPVAKGEPSVSKADTTPTVGPAPTAPQPDEHHKKLRVEPGTPRSPPLITEANKEHFDKASKEAQKPKVETKAPEPVKASAPAPTQAPTPAAPKPSTLDTLKAAGITPIKAMAQGGTLSTNSHELSAYPIGGLRGDNTIVADENRKPVFTMNTNKEAAVFDPSRQQVSVIPNDKKLDPNTPPDQGSNFIDQLNEMYGTFDSQIQQMSKKLMGQNQSESSNDRSPFDMENVFDSLKTIFLNPTVMRAINRTRGKETGDLYGESHYNNGNTDSG